jgi:DegV family protein with EDD domain
MQLNVDNTAVVLDSTADFPEAAVRFPSWRIVPLYVRFGDESFRDYEELGPAEFYERLRTAPETPTTSQPTPGDFLAAYEELAGFERILSLHISAKLSGTAQSARTAAEQVGDDRIRVFDSQTASAAIAMLALAVHRRLERGTTDEEVAELVKNYAREAGLLFTVDTLEYLRKGGRIGRAAAFAGNLLHVRPILSIENGEVLPIKRVRGNQKAFAEFRETFLATTSPDDTNLRVGIAQAVAPERMRALVELVEHERPNAAIDVTTTLGAVVGAHAGPGTIGFFWHSEAST